MAKNAFEIKPEVWALSKKLIDSQARLYLEYSIVMYDALLTNSKKCAETFTKSVVDIYKV